MNALAISHLWLARVAALLLLAPLGWALFVEGGWAWGLLVLAVPPALLYGIATIVFDLFNIRAESSPGGQRRRASAWMLASFAPGWPILLGTGGLLVQVAIVAALFAVRDLRRGAACWIAPLCTATAWAVGAAVAAEAGMEPLVCLACLAVAMVLGLHASVDLLEWRRTLRPTAAG
jgi:hypothetical protein